MNSHPPVFDDRWKDFQREGNGAWIRRACEDGYEFGIALYRNDVFIVSKRKSDGKGADYQSRVIGQDEAWAVANQYAKKHGGWAE